MKRCASLLTLGLTCALLAGPTRAQVTNYVLFKSLFYDQTTDFQPVSPTSAAFASDLLVTDANNLSAATISFAGALSPLSMTPAGTRYSYTSGFLATQAQMDADYPDSATYQFDISGGTLGPASATATLPAAARYSESVPFFTGAVFNALQGIDPSASFTLSWDGYGAVPGTNQSLAFLQVFDVTASSLIFNDAFDNAAQSVFMPGGSLTANHTYVATLYYSSRSDTAFAGFGSATATVAADRATRMTFTAGSGLTSAAPEAGAGPLALLGLAAGSVAIRRRRS